MFTHCKALDGFTGKIKMIAKTCIRHLATACVLVLVSACSFVRDADINKIRGPIGGAVTGSEVSGAERNVALLGSLLERINGDEVWGTLNDEDRRLMGALAFIVLDHGADGHTEPWRNPGSRNHGTFTAHTTWRTSDEVECRRFTNMIHVAKTESRESGTACRQRDGTWAVVG